MSKLTSPYNSMPVPMKGYGVGPGIPDFLNLLRPLVEYLQQRACMSGKIPTEYISYKNCEKTNV